MSEKKRKTQTPSQEITSELERTIISSSPSQRSRTSRQTSPPSLSTTRISRQASPRFSSRERERETSPPSFSSTITTGTPTRTSPPSFSSTTTATSRTRSTSRTQRPTSPSSQIIDLSSSPPSPPYVFIPHRPSNTSTDRPSTTSTDRPSITSTNRSIARFTISTRGHIESTPRRTYGRVRGRGIGKGLSRKYKGKGKEVIRDDYGSPQEGWIDIGSGIKKSVSLESQIKYTIENNHVYIKFYFKNIYIFLKILSN